MLLSLLWLILSTAAADDALLAPPVQVFVGCGVVSQFARAFEICATLCLWLAAMFLTLPQLVNLSDAV